ncbi:copper ion binding / methyltransferase isoform X2 [Wolffia australiana]
MAQALGQETVKKALAAARQSDAISIVPLRLRRSIKRFLREKESTRMHRNVLMLSESLCNVKRANLAIAEQASRELIDDPLKEVDIQSRRWKIRSSYGDIGLSYREDETAAYVASRMPAVFSACRRILREVRRRLPDFCPSKVLDFGAGPGTAFWAIRDVWPRSIDHVNLVEPSKSMQRACQSLLQNSKNLPLIRSYDNLQALSRDIDKNERGHDLVIASYVLGEIPSLRDRVTVVRQLWSLTKDVLIIVEPGTPQGSKTICQMRSHILWMSKRKSLKAERAIDPDSSTDGAFVVAPCPHDGACPLEKSTKYCHFVQRLERTSTQRTFKRSKGGGALRGFEDEKFAYVAFRRGRRPRESWPLDGVDLAALDDDLIVDYDDDDDGAATAVDDDHHHHHVGALMRLSDAEGDGSADDEEAEDDGEAPGLGGGWGRIVFPPVRRGRHVAMHVCRTSEPGKIDGRFERVVVTRSKNPVLHRQARKSLWGDLWPF